MLFFDHLIFVYIEALILLPLPLLMALLPWPYPSRRSALKMPALQSIIAASGTQSQTRLAVSKASRLQIVFASLVWVLVIVSLARPQLLGEPIIEEFSQRDLLLAIDLSGSMETKDFTLVDGQTVDRLTAVKSILTPFLDQRRGERIAMIFFGSAAFVQAPFTTDLKALKALLNEAQVAMAGPKTVIGDSIALAVKLFAERKIEERLLILLTDGNDTRSKIPPEQATKLAVEQQIKIITIAVGDPENAGENALDSQTLKAIASDTGGQFYYALDSQQLKQVIEQINQLMPKKVERQSYTPTTELYIWPLAVALLLILVYSALILLIPTKFRHQ